MNILQINLSEDERKFLFELLRNELAEITPEDKEYNTIWVLIGKIGSKEKTEDTSELLNILTPHKLTKREIVDWKIKDEITENERASELELLARDDRTAGNL